MHEILQLSLQIKRCEVSDSQVEWTEPYPDYSPADYTAPHILAGPFYADKEIGLVFVYCMFLFIYFSL